MAGKRRGSRGRGGKALKPAQTSPGLATTQAPAGRPRHGRPIVDADAKRALKSLLGQAAAQRGQESAGKDFAAEETSAQVDKAVITVPAYSSNSQPQATMDSGCFAENVLRKDRQSHAESALGRAKDSLDSASDEADHQASKATKEGQSYLVSTKEQTSQLFGQTQVQKTVITVPACLNDNQGTHLWGDNFDRRIEDFLADDFQRNKGTGLRMDGQALQRLTEGGEMANRALSTLSQVVALGAIEFEKLREDLSCPLGRLLRGFYGFPQLRPPRPRQLPAINFHALWDVSGAYQVQMAMTLVLVSAKTPLLASVSDSALALALAKVQGVCSERTQVARATPDRKGRQQDPHTDARDAIRRAGAFSQSQLLRAVVNVGPLAVSAIAWGPSGGGLPGAITHNADTGERTLEPGAIMLAGRGISDLNKIGNIDRAATHEVTEQQTVALHNPMYGPCYDVNSLPPNTYQTLTQFTIQDKLSFKIEHEATFVPPVAGADAQSMAAAVQRIKAVLDMPLLHRAACSQSVPLVQMVQEWTSAVGINLLAGVPGPKGLTALHLAADMEDSASLAALLTGKRLEASALVLDAEGNNHGGAASLQLAITTNKEIVLRDYASPGGMMISADSRAPNAGGLGMCAVGVGSADAVDVVAGLPREHKVIPFNKHLHDYLVATGCKPAVKLVDAFASNLRAIKGAKYGQVIELNLDPQINGPFMPDLAHTLLLPEFSPAGMPLRGQEAQGISGLGACPRTTGLVFSHASGLMIAQPHDTVGIDQGIDSTTFTALGDAMQSAGVLSLSPQKIGVHKDKAAEDDRKSGHGQLQIVAYSGMHAPPAGVPPLAAAQATELAPNQTATNNGLNQTATNNGPNQTSDVVLSHIDADPISGTQVLDQAEVVTAAAPKTKKKFVFKKFLKKMARCFTCSATLP